MVMRNPRFKKLLEEIEALHDSKNHDYTPDGDPLANLKASQSFGVEPYRGALVRMSDKWSRIGQLASGKTAKHESLRDSLIDLSVYALLTVLLLEDAGVRRDG